MNFLLQILKFSGVSISDKGIWNEILIIRLFNRTFFRFRPYVCGTIPHRHLRDDCIENVGTSTSHNGPALSVTGIAFFTFSLSLTEMETTET
jgi:hypothetical protein